MKTVVLLCWLAPAPPLQLAAMLFLTWRIAGGRHV
jgi:hypothetical protein